MREDICSIPISEVLEKQGHCPICTMYAMLEERMIDYISGAAMMEPDVRIQTNRLGFCHRHFSKLLGVRNRLAVGLMLDSHLKEIHAQVFPAKGLPFGKPDAKKQAGRAAEMCGSCFVCEKIDWGMERLLATLLRLYEQQLELREQFSAQKGLCLNHFALLTRLSAAKKGRYTEEFQAVCKSLAKQTLTELEGDVAHFCSMFDYRNSEQDADWKNAKDSLERSVRFLTGFDPGKY